MKYTTKLITPAMKAILSGVVLACLSLMGAQWGMGPGPGTPALVSSTPATLVQSTSGFALGSSYSLAYSSDTTTGHLLVAVGWLNIGGPATSASVTDTGGCTWNLATWTGFSGSNNGSIGIWYCLSAAGGADTVSISGAGGNWYSLILMEFPTSSGFDVGGATSGGGGSETLTATASGPVTGNDVVVFGAADPNHGGTYTTPTDFTSVAYVNGSFGITSQGWYRTNLQNSGTPSATSTVTAGDNFRVAIAAFKQ